MVASIVKCRLSCHVAASGEVEECLDILDPTGLGAAGVHEAGKQLQVVLDDDDSVHADVVLSAVGLRAGLDLARDAGLDVDRGDLDDRCRSRLCHRLSRLL